MKTRIEIKDWKCIDKIVPTYKNTLTEDIITEKKNDGYFEYFDKFYQYLGRYNSEFGIFDDELVVVILDSEYGRGKSE